MVVLQTENLDLSWVEETIWVLSKEIGAPSYDFDFQQHFHCQHPSEPLERCMAVSRAGPRAYYQAFYGSLLTDGVQLIHDPATHLLCSELPHWYPLIKHVTPRSLWFDEIPDVEAVTAQFNWPIFVRGSEKSRHHSKRLSIINGPDEYEHMRQIFTQDRVLQYQQLVCREFVPLRKVADVDGDLIPASFEFRTFWWRGQFVGSGRYWVDAPYYAWTEGEKVDAIAIAKQAAVALPVTFLVIDVGQRTDGQWVVIEVNDGQDCGYSGMSPMQLWQNIIAVERQYLK